MIELISSVFRSLVEAFVGQQRARQKGDFVFVEFVFSSFEIIKTKTGRKVRSHSFYCGALR